MVTGSTHNPPQGRSLEIPALQGEGEMVGFKSQRFKRKVQCMKPNWISRGVG